MIKEELDYEPISAYIKKKRAEGLRVSLMNVIVAAFVKTVVAYPEFNRFIMNKKIYQRNEICVSHAMLKKQVDEKINETTVKLFFDETDNIYTITEKMNKAIEDFVVAVKGSCEALITNMKGFKDDLSKIKQAMEAKAQNVNTSVNSKSNDLNSSKSGWTYSAGESN